MINLLPPEEKQNIFLLKKEKLTIIWGIIILVFLFCLGLILLSIRFRILAETNYQKNALEQAKKENQTRDFISLNNVIQKYNKELAQLDSFYKKEIYFHNTLSTIMNVPSPKGLYLMNFSLSRGKTGAVQVNISGIADTRDNLLDFKKNIEENKEIKNIYFSPESWVSPKNVNFSLTFEID